MIDSLKNQTDCKIYQMRIGILLALIMLSINLAFSTSPDQNQTDSLKLMRKADSMLTKQRRDSIMNRELEIQISELRKLIAADTSTTSQKHLPVTRKIPVVNKDSLLANPVPILLDGDTIIFIYSPQGSISTIKRANKINDRITAIANDPAYDSMLFEIVEREDFAELNYDEEVVLAVSTIDSVLFKEPVRIIAKLYQREISKAIADYRSSISVINILKRIGLTLIVLVILYLIIKYLNIWINNLIRWVFKGKINIERGVRVRNYELVSAFRLMRIIVSAAKILKWFLILLVIYICLPVLFSIFPATEGIAKMLINLVLDPIKNFFRVFINYIPNFITIVVILIIAFYAVRGIRVLSRDVTDEKLHIPGFYPDWALPTFNILRFLIYIFAFIVIFPYLPGSDSEVFRGVSVFLGLLISIGSSTAIGNLIAGLVITYMRAFKIGDRVRIGDTVGDVVERTMLITRLKTIKNEFVTIPNAAILTGHTINFSASMAEKGLILHTSVTIGYDVPWKKVEQLLIEAAINTDLIEKDPTPFVLQTSLDDFYVSYQLNAHTLAPEKSAVIYSQLHANIQDSFSRAGVEIMSPHFRVMREGSNETTIPKQ